MYLIIHFIAAWDCDVLIHEASYEDTLIRKRNVNKHRYSVIYQGMHCNM